MRPDTATLLRFLTCGSVDDGKSTLIGRLLLEAGQIFDDQLAALKRDSQRHGTTGADTDLALLVDGLEAEREQGITIDVAYRYFATPRRSFIVADTPGHEQYTRNMATGASGSDLAILLVDARKGLLVQTCRHATICSLLGIRHFVLAINKIDLVGFDETVFRQIVDDFELLSARLGLGSVTAIPVSARYGDNVSSPSLSLPWYDGRTLLSHLEYVSVTADPVERPFRFPVQWVNRPDANFRGYAGTVSSGRVGVGETVISAMSGVAARVQRIIGPDDDQDEAKSGDAVTIVLSDEIDLSRGDVLATAENPPVVANQLSANLIWMSGEPLLPGRGYLMRIGPRWVPASVTLLKHKLNVATQEELATATLELNEIGVANLSLASSVAIDRYEDNRRGGAFILVDRFSNELVAAGMIRHPLRRALNIVPEHALVEKQARAALKQQKSCCVWFTGLSGSGKSTLAKGLEKRLHELGRHTMLLDGDNLRLGLNGDLGFTSADRVENIRRAGEVARLMTEAGLIVLCSFISPFQAERDMVRGLFGPEEFIEVFVDTPLGECQRRDVKGLYARALRGEIPNFTGVSSPYEAPGQPDVRIDGSTPVGAATADLERHLDAVLAPLVARLGAVIDVSVCAPDAGLDVDAYRALLVSDSGNLIYATLDFLSFLQSVTGAEVQLLLARRDGELVGALAFAVSTVAGVGSVVNSLPWWGSHGSVLLDRSRADADAIRAALAGGLADQAERLGALSSTLVLLPAENDSRFAYEQAYRPDVTEDRIGQMTTLPPDGADLDDRLLALFVQKTRNLVRKGMKQGFVERLADEGWAWDFLAETHAQNIAALGGRSKPRQHFTALRENIPPDMRRLAVAMDGERPVAAMLTLSFNGTVEYLTPAISVEERPRQPLSFLIFHGMLEAVRRGDRVWNWGGTGVTQISLHHFKAGFGADDRPYTYLIRASASAVSLFRQRKSELTELFPYFYAYPYGLLDDPA